MSPTLWRLCPGCRVAIITPPETRCPGCRRAYEAARPSRRARGRYDRTYQRLRLAVLERDGYTCRYCGRPATTADHVVPLARGGVNALDNLVAACASCNSARGAR